jgi:predicted kinase
MWNGSVNERERNPSPALIVIGGFAGTGKTAVSRRLSSELYIPRLASDTIGRTIENSAGIKNGQVDAYWIAYEVLFRLCEEFVQSGVSVILDLTLGWEFQWRHLDRIVRGYPRVLFLPVILRCPHAQCVARIRQRYEAHPERYDPPELYVTEPKILGIWEYLARLDRPDVHFIDASGPQDHVYEAVREYVVTQIES